MPADTTRIVHDTTTVVSNPGYTVLWVLLIAIVLGAIGMWVLFGRKRQTVVTEHIEHIEPTDSEDRPSE